MIGYAKDYLEEVKKSLEESSSTPETEWHTSPDFHYDCGHSSYYLGVLFYSNMYTRLTEQIKVMDIN